MMAVGPSASSRKRPPLGSPEAVLLPLSIRYDDLERSALRPRQEAPGAPLLRQAGAGGSSSRLGATRRRHAPAAFLPSFRLVPQLLGGARGRARARALL